METLTQMFIDRWAKPWFEYTEKKVCSGPDIIGNMVGLTCLMGDNMAMYAWHQMPAIDMLFNQYDDSHPQAQFGNVRSVKELSSVANRWVM